MPNYNLTWREPIYTVEEFFAWKLKAKSNDSVEKYNREFTDILEWERTDTLYSFQKIYQIGLQLPEFKEELAEARKITGYKGRICDKGTQSALCKHMNSLNDKINEIELLSVYFYLGNVIPIWPGGNQDKGAGYDFPETYFNKEHNIFWTQKLLEKYPNACMEEVINNRIDACKIKTDTQAYLGYLRSRKIIISERTKKLRGEICRKLDSN